MAGLLVSPPLTVWRAKRIENPETLLPSESRELKPATNLFCLENLPPFLFCHEHLGFQVVYYCRLAWARLINQAGSHNPIAIGSFLRGFFALISLLSLITLRPINNRRPVVVWNPVFLVSALYLLV
jgi:hypothetical protein